MTASSSLQIWWSQAGWRSAKDIVWSRAATAFGLCEDAFSAEVTEPGSSSPLEVTVKIRYSHPGTRATVTPLENGRARIQLHEPQKAVTPGQAAVIYDGDIVLGGGWICRAAALQLA